VVYITRLLFSSRYSNALSITNRDGAVQ